MIQVFKKKQLSNVIFHLFQVIGLWSSCSTTLKGLGKYINTYIFNPVFILSIFFFAKQQHFRDVNTNINCQEIVGEQEYKHEGTHTHIYIHMFLSVQGYKRRYTPKIPSERGTTQLGSILLAIEPTEHHIEYCKYCNDCNC